MKIKFNKVRYNSKHLDHMYCNSGDKNYSRNTTNDEDNNIVTGQELGLENRKLKAMLLLHLDLIQEQNDQLIAKDKELLLRQEENIVLHRKVAQLEVEIDEIKKQLQRHLKRTVVSQTRPPPLAKIQNFSEPVVVTKNNNIIGECNGKLISKIVLQRVNTDENDIVSLLDVQQQQQQQQQFREQHQQQQQQQQQSSCTTANVATVEHIEEIKSNEVEDKIEKIEQSTKAKAKDDDDNHNGEAEENTRNIAVELPKENVKVDCIDFDIEKDFFEEQEEDQMSKIVETIGQYTTDEDSSNDIESEKSFQRNQFDSLDTSTTLAATLNDVITPTTRSSATTPTTPSTPSRAKSVTIWHADETFSYECADGDDDADGDGGGDICGDIVNSDHDKDRKAHEDRHENLDEDANMESEMLDSDKTEIATVQDKSNDGIVCDNDDKDLVSTGMAGTNITTTTTTTTAMSTTIQQNNTKLRRCSYLTAEYMYDTRGWEDEEFPCDNEFTSEEANALLSDAPNLEIPKWIENENDEEMFDTQTEEFCHEENGEESIEELYDDSYLKRHAKFEVDEKRRKKWDVQQIREQRRIEKLKKRHCKDINAMSQEKEQIASFYPMGETVQAICFMENLPVQAFGEVITKIDKGSGFTLPWEKDEDSVVSSVTTTQTSSEAKAETTNEDKSLIRKLSPADKMLMLSISSPSPSSPPPPPVFDQSIKYPEFDYSIFFTTANNNTATQSQILNQESSIYSKFVLLKKRKRHQSSSASLNVAAVAVTTTTSLNRNTKNNTLKTSPSPTTPSSSPSAQLGTASSSANTISEPFSN